MLKICYSNVHPVLTIGPTQSYIDFGESEVDSTKATIEMIAEEDNSVLIILDSQHPDAVLKTLDQLQDAAKQARCWMLRQLCDCCEEKTKEPGSRYCSECNNAPYTDPAVDPRGK